MSGVERIKAKVRFKESEQERLDAMDEIHRMNEEMAEHRAQQSNVPRVEDYEDFSPAKPEPEETHTGKVVKRQVLELTADDLAKIIAAAKGDYVPNEREPLPPDAPFTAKVADFTEDAVGEVGRGAHRMVDGCREIIAGAIDIVTLGRAHRK